MALPDACLRAIGHVEEHLSERVTVADLADAAGYSLFHFSRAFARDVRMSPYTYLVRRRLTRAVADVVGTDRRVLDVAIEHGFESHEGFTRAFARAFGCTPTEARAAGRVRATGRLPRLGAEHLACLARHGGLAASGVVDAGPEPGGTCVATPLRWPPGGASSSRPASEPASWVVFALTGEPDDAATVVEWLVHGWAFAARAELALPGVWIVPASAGSPARAFVPVG
jgi:AraC-like DNA-binding protein